MLPVLSSGQQELLKWLAIVSMALDHSVRVLAIGTPLFPLGRLAFPLFAFLLAYNVACRGVSPRKYHRPLLFFALLAQPAYSLAFGTWQLNILFTLLLATLALDALERSPQHLQEPALLILLLLAIPVDSSVVGWTLIILLSHTLRHPSALTMGTVLVLTALLNLGGGLVMSAAGVLALALPYLIRLVPLPTLPRSRWAFYIFYPVHLYLLLIMQALN